MDDTSRREPDRRGKILHFFHHTVKDRFRDRKAEETVARAIMGHESSGTASSYGSGHSLTGLDAGLQQLNDPGHDLSHLVAK